MNIRNGNLLKEVRGMITLKQKPKHKNILLILKQIKKKKPSSNYRFSLSLNSKYLLPSGIDLIPRLISMETLNRISSAKSNEFIRYNIQGKHTALVQSEAGKG